MLCVVQTDGRGARPERVGRAARPRAGGRSVRPQEPRGHATRPRERDSSQEQLALHRPREVSRSPLAVPARPQAAGILTPSLTHTHTHHTHAPGYTPSRMIYIPVLLGVDSGLHHSICSLLSRK